MNPFRYRVALMRDEAHHYTMAVVNSQDCPEVREGLFTNEDAQRLLAGSKRFVRWLTDWTEVQP